MGGGGGWRDILSPRALTCAHMQHTRAQQSASLCPACAMLGMLKHCAHDAATRPGISCSHTHAQGPHPLPKDSPLSPTCSKNTRWAMSRQLRAHAAHMIMPVEGRVCKTPRPCVTAATPAHLRSNHSRDRGNVGDRGGCDTHVPAQAKKTQVSDWTAQTRLRIVLDSSAPWPTMRAMRL